MSLRLCGSLLLFNLLTLVLRVGAAPIAATFGSSKDNTIFAKSVNNSLGGGPGLFSGTDSSGATGKLRAMISFDLLTIPSNAVVIDAKLTLVLGQVAGNESTARTIELHRVLADWGEGTAGSTSTTIGGTGQGFPAGPGDATWNERLFGTAAWTTPGGDFSSTVSASTVVINPQNTTTPFSWLATPTLLADIQSWVQNNTTNFGWLLQNTNESSSQTFRAFWTKEASNPAFRPQLSVTYVVPEPATWGLLLSGIVAMLMFRAKLGR